MHELEKTYGKTIKKINKVYDTKGELWRLNIIFQDDSEFNVYMCLNVDYYFDYDYFDANDVFEKLSQCVCCESVYKIKNSDSTLQESCCSKNCEENYAKAIGNIEFL